jgi:hypothetical protein
VLQSFTRVSGAGNELPAQRKLGDFPLSKRLGDVVFACQGLGEGPGVFSGLRGAACSMGTGRERCVTDQTNASKGRAVDFEIEYDLNKWLDRPPDYLGEWQW